MNTSRNLTITIILVITVMVVGYYLMRSRTGAPVPETSQETATATSTADAMASSSVSADVSINGTGNYTVKEDAVMPTPAASTAPDYTKPLTFGSSIETNVRTALTAQHKATVAALQKDPKDFQALINLGIVRKMAGDYAGAEEIWLYAGKLYPKSTVPTDDLGVLYMDFLKNLPKAEANFQASIKNDPHDINAHQQLFALYTVYGYKAGTSAAADLVAQGLKDNPGNETLLLYRSQLSK